MLTENGLTPLQNAALATPTVELAHQLVGTYLASKSAGPPVIIRQGKVTMTGLVRYAGTTPINRGWWRTLLSWLGLR
jgi:hypothetical protein